MTRSNIGKVIFCTFWMVFLLSCIAHKQYSDNVLIEQLALEYFDRKIYNNDKQLKNRKIFFDGLIVKKQGDFLKLGLCLRDINLSEGETERFRMLDSLNDNSLDIVYPDIQLSSDKIDNIIFKKALKNKGKRMYRLSIYNKMVYVNQNYVHLVLDNFDGSNIHYFLKVNKDKMKVIDFCKMSLTN